MTKYEEFELLLSQLADDELNELHRAVFESEFWKNGKENADKKHPS